MAKRIQSIRIEFVLSDDFNRLVTLLGGDPVDFEEALRSCGLRPVDERTIDEEWSELQKHGME